MTSHSLTAGEYWNGAGVLPAMLKGGELIVGGLLAFTIPVKDAEAGDAMVSYRKTMQRFFNAIARGSVTDPPILDASIMSVGHFRNFTSIVFRGTLAGPLEALGQRWPNSVVWHSPGQEDLEDSKAATMPTHGSVVWPITLSVIEKEMIEETLVLVLVSACGDDDQRYYAYAAVRADVLPSVIEAQQRGRYDIRQYGVILEAGSGDPEADVKWRMARDYGFRHDHAFTMSGVSIQPDI